MKKKWILPAVLLLGGCLLLAGCGKKSSSSGGQTVKAISAAGNLTVAVYDIGTGDTAQDAVSGRFTRIAEQVGTYLKVPVTYQTVDTAADAAAMVAGENAAMAIGRISGSDYSSCGQTEICCTEYVYVVTRRGDYSDSRAAFENRNLAVSEKLPADALYSLYGDSQIRITELAYSAVQQQLEGRQLDGYLCTEEEAKTFLSYGNEVQVQQFLDPSMLSYRILVPEDDASFLSAVNTVIAETAE